MKNFLILTVITTTIALMAACSAEDPFEDYSSNDGWNNSGNMPGSNGGNSGNGSSATTGELATFDIALNTESTEPTESTEEYFPDEEDALENNEFTKEVTIDLSNPVAKTENGVEVTVNGGHVTANHQAEKNVCYVVSGAYSGDSRSPIPMISVHSVGDLLYRRQS